MALERIDPFLHQSTVLSKVVLKDGTVFYLATVPLRPTTPVIVEKSTTDGTWTAVVENLTGVLTWSLSEKSGLEYDYAYVAAPSASRRMLGIVQKDTALANLYVRRIGSTDLNMQLDYWTV